MTDALLRALLEPVARRRRAVQLWLRLAQVWVVAAVVGVAGVFVLRGVGLAWALWFPLVTAIGAVACGITAYRMLRRPLDYADAARRIEAGEPALGGLVTTAVEQVPSEGVTLSFLQEQLVEQAVQRGRASRWSAAFPASFAWGARLAHLAALVALLWVAWTFRPGPAPRRSTAWLPTRPSEEVRRGLSVQPGDVEIERGESLVVLARFGSEVPEKVDLRIGSIPASARRIPLVKSLSDPVFGGSVPNVTEDFPYCVEYSGKETQTYKVTVFEYPKLERSDVTLTYPAYTGLAPKRIEDTRRVTAVNGTTVDLALQLNKPVAQASLVGRGEPRPTIPLTVSSNASASLNGYPLTQSQSLDLVLVDDRGRTNKMRTTFVFEVLTNRTPEIQIASPRGDLQPSPLEELNFEATVWDDFGVLASGIAFAVGEGEPKFIELGSKVPARERQTFRHLLRLEELGLKPDESIYWFAWADDLGPDGQVRRTTTDLFFGEIRPFDKIFRENQGGGGQQGGEQAGGQNPNQKLIDLQKQIITATTRLSQRGRSNLRRYLEDLGTIHESQAQALEQAHSSQGEAEQPHEQELWNVVIRSMTNALQELGASSNAVASLSKAQSAERAAHQALLRFRSRETEVQRQRGRQGGQGGQGDEHFQQELDQLDLTQNEDRYEQQRQARATESPQRREQLQVLNRLQELARRQKDVNDRLKEMQAALQEARTEREREELQRQLKRLTEEQRQMIADLDELRQRMERPENESAMSGERRQLDEAREGLQAAADAASRQSLGQAVAAGARAQEQLQELRDQVRKQNSGEFAEDMREMRTQARQLARDEEDIGRRLNQLAEGARKSLDTAGEKRQLVQDLERQKASVSNIVARATQLSEQAEASEPALSRQLYDTLRQLKQEDGKHLKEFREELMRRGMLTESLNDHLQALGEKEEAKTLELAAEMLRRGYLRPADAAEQKARTGIDGLRRGVERAAERVIGDDTGALRQAEAELEALSRELAREGDAELGTNAPGRLAQGNSDHSANNPGRGRGRPSQGSTPGNRGEPSGDDPATQGEGQAGERPPDGAGQPTRPSTAQSAGNDPAEGAGSSPGQNPAPGREGQQSGAGQGRGQAQQQGQGEGQGEGQGQGRGRRPGQNAQQPGGGGESPQELAGQEGRGGGGRQDAEGQRGGRGGLADRRTGSREPREPADDGGVLQLLGGGGDGRGGGRNGGAAMGPLTGEDFGEWSDRLREVEESVDDPALRTRVATARERARQVRLEYRRERKKPDWAVVKLEIINPLVEVRSQIRDELARRESRESLVPIDREPVPQRFTEMVRRYYEELGKSQ